MDTIEKSNGRAGIPQFAWRGAWFGALVLGAGLLVPVIAAATAGAARADEPVPVPVTEKTEKTEKAKRPSVDAAAVYLGRASCFSKPAEVDADAVYAAIPAYRTILDDEVEAGCARYELLMDEASRNFKTAIRKVAREAGYDLIARVGSVRNVADIPDVTQAAIDRL